MFDWFTLSAEEQTAVLLSLKVALWAKRTEVLNNVVATGVLPDALVECFPNEDRAVLQAEYTAIPSANIPAAGAALWDMLVSYHFPAIG